MNDSPVLVEIIRGSIPELRHRGAIAVVNGVRETVARLGDINGVSYLRSAAKPFQALPLIVSGALERYHITERELAVMAGSHGGERIHQDAVSDILRKIGLGPEALKCGGLQHPCSGKHAGMLTLCRFLGEDLATYDRPDHPLQRRNQAMLAKICDLQPEEISIGVDGCGVPTFAMPILKMATGMARLVSADSQTFDDSLKQACHRIVKAMAEFPEMIGASQNRPETDLMRIAHGKLISKEGAGGIFTVGLLPNERHPTGLGIAIKIEDGDQPSVGITAIEALRQLGELSAEQADKLAKYKSGEVRFPFQLPGCK